MNNLNNKNNKNNKNDKNQPLKAYQSGDKPSSDKKSAAKKIATRKSVTKKSAKAIMVLAIITLLALLAFVLWWLKPNNANTPSVVTDDSRTQNNQNITQDTANTSTANNKASVQTQFKTGLETLPRSLQDTDVDGEIIVDGNKQLVVTEGLRRLFDYFLSALGEEDEATIAKRVEAYIRHHTPEPAASDAVALFEQYVAYLKALTQIQDRYGNLQMQATEAGEMDLTLVAQRRNDISNLRKQYFDDATITAFFGAEDAYDDYSIAMMRIQSDDSLTEAQKQAARDDYISRLPDSPIKQNVQQQKNLTELMQRTEALKAQGASPQQLFAMRRELVGEAAAARLAKVDEEEADFDARFNQYQSQRAALIDGAGSQAAAQAQIAELEQQLFDETERKRLTGYAAMKQQQQSDEAFPSKTN